MFGYIIVNQQIGHNEYKVHRFKEEFSKKNIQIELKVNDGTLAWIENGAVKTNLLNCDFVLYLDKDIYLARMLERAGFRLFNKADFIKMCDDKTLTFIGCANLGIPMIETYAGPLVYSSNENPDLSFLETIIKNLGFPMVVKKVYGSLGEGVFLVENKEELVNLYKKICKSPILFQKFMKNNFGRSIRVLVIDGKVFGSFARTNDGDFRSNFGTSPSGKILDNPSKYENFAQRIADLLNIEYAGIDLLDDEDGNPILCEINSNAFFEEFEKITHLNVGEAVANMVINKVKHEQE